MAKAKTDFTKNAKKVTDAIAEATQLPGQLELQQDGTIIEPKKERKERKTYNAQEAQEALEALKTQGRKGLAAPRINLAFTPTIYDYIKTMSAVRGESMTEFINFILQQNLDNNIDLYLKAKEFKNNFRK